MCFPRGSVAFWATECLTPQICFPCQVLTISKVFIVNPPIHSLPLHGYRPRLTDSDFLPLRFQISARLVHFYLCVRWSQHSPFSGAAHVTHSILTRYCERNSHCMDWSNAPMGCRPTFHIVTYAYTPYRLFIEERILLCYGLHRD